MIKIEMISMTITMEITIIIMIKNINDNDWNDINYDSYGENIHDDN